MANKKKIILNKVEVRIQETALGEFLCLTDLAKVAGDNTGEVLSNWLRLIGTIEFLKEFELKYDPDFNVVEYDNIRMNAGSVRFRLSAKQWMERTKAIGIISEPGRYGGTYAHNAIALEFCSAISPAFKLGVYVDYLELKEQAAQSLLSAYEFYLQKIEDNTVEAAQLVQDIKKNISKNKNLNKNRKK